MNNGSQLCGILGAQLSVFPAAGNAVYERGAMAYWTSHYRYYDVTVIYESLFI